MASNYRRCKSRRRFAALSFLNNITLNGSHIDTQIGMLLNLEEKLTEVGNTCRVNPMVIECAVKAEELDIYKGQSSLNTTENDDCIENEFLQCQVGSLGLRGPEIDSYRNSGINTPFRERTSTAGSEYAFERRLGSVGHKKKIPVLLHQSSLNDDKLYHNFSSSESLGSIIGRKSAVIHEVNSPDSTREIRIVQPAKGQHFRDEQIVFSTSSKIPLLFFSNIPYNRCFRPFRVDQRREGGRRRNTSGPRPLSSINDLDPYKLLGLERAPEGQEISYAKLLKPSLERKPEVDIDSQTLKKQYVSRGFSYESQQRLSGGNSPPPSHSELNFSVEDWDRSDVYSPDLLDDPALIVGKHCTLLTFTAYMTSIIDYTRPSDLKKELNDKFRERFPNIKLTLSKLRSLKREMRKIAKQDSSADLLTVAQAYVYFEKLILRTLINKENRKLCAGACLILSAKLNDCKGEQLKQLFERVESTFRLSRKDLVAFELAVLVALEFSLHVPTWQVLPHYQRLIHDS